MRKERAVPQTVLWIHPDGAKARRATEALFNSIDGFYNVEWVARRSHLVLRSLEHEDAAKLAVLHGAQDYLLEDHLDSYLPPKALRNALERSSNAEAQFRDKERARLTLDSIGDAVVCTHGQMDSSTVGVREPG